MAQDKIAVEAVNAVSKLMMKMPDDSAKADALNVLMMTNYNLMRDIEGDEFVRAWLQTALQDLEANPPVIGLARVH
jgi:O-methyltransferase involved in polyketide biosynthesis